MARITMEEHVEYPTLPADSILYLKVIENTVREAGSNGRTWEKLEFKFKILGIQVTGDGSPIEDYETLIGQHIWGSVSYKFNDSPENRLKQWVEAILGLSDLGVGFDLDTDVLNGKSVRGITSQYERKNIDPRTGRPFKAHQINSLLIAKGDLPARGGATSAWDSPPPAQQAAPPPANFGDPWSQPATPQSTDDPWAQPASQPAQQAQPQAVGGGSSLWGNPDDPPPF